LLKGWAFYAYLYCDFSGYCDIVIGIGSLLGVRPPENFNFPFFSRNVAEYWLRVHRSLTEWLTAYVFTPLYAEGLRLWQNAALLAMAVAIMITMVVSGLWHGTTLAFLIFGLLHGFYLVVYRLYEKGLRSALPATQRIALAKNPAVIAASIFVTFNACSLAYLCFIMSGKQLGQVVSNVMHRI
jgi:D-alanyl-lipoteichoic acid acyltransferase DltB (MBOAT superfamily)